MAPEICMVIQRGKTFEFGFLYGEDDLLYLLSPLCLALHPYVSQ